ncbi:hypothetical protein EG68_12497, partial [Paragonimus skrjabini miyazakii]
MKRFGHSFCRSTLAIACRVSNQITSVSKRYEAIKKRYTNRSKMENQSPFQMSDISDPK